MNVEICCVVLHGSKVYVLQKSEMSKEEEGYRRRSSRLWALEEAAKFKQKEKEEKDKEAKEKLRAKQNASPSMPLPDRKRGRKKKRLEEVVVSSVARVTFSTFFFFAYYILYAHALSTPIFPFFSLSIPKSQLVKTTSNCIHAHHPKPCLLLSLILRCFSCKKSCYLNDLNCISISISIFLSFQFLHHMNPISLLLSQSTN